MVSVGGAPAPGLVSRAPGPAERDDGFWALVAHHDAQVRAAVLSHLEAGEPELLHELQVVGRLRQFLGDPEGRGHFAWFERGGELRLLVAPGRLCAATLENGGLWLLWQGSKGALPEGLAGCIEAVWATSVPVEPGESLDGAESERPPVTYSRPIPSVREVLGIRSTKDYFDLDAESQELALWSTLIGEGPVDLEQAVRLAAERLRAQGFLEYQVLRQDGRVHAALEEGLLAARRNTSLFDRPRNGFVRAVEADLGALTAEQWRDCVMGSLEEGARVDRDQAARQGFEYAQSVYGVEAQRLRSGGRADQALRSAINSAIRQGYLERDGAAYLVRVALSAPPTLRGVIGSETESAPTEAAPAPSAAPATEAGAEAAAAPAPFEESIAGLSGAPTQSPTPSEVSPSLLDSKVELLDLPVRTLNWASRVGLDTLRELVAWRPEDFARERNIGRRTVRETRELIESLLGCSWESAWASVHGRSAFAGAETGDGEGGETDDEAVDSATEALTAGGAKGWARVAAYLSEAERALLLREVALPTRMRNPAEREGITTLGELFGRSHEALMAQGNIGRKSLNDTLDAVRDHLSERAAPPVYATFVESWQSQLGALEPIRVHHRDERHRRHPAFRGRAPGSHPVLRIPARGGRAAPAGSRAANPGAGVRQVPR